MRLVYAAFSAAMKFEYAHIGALWYKSEPGDAFVGSGGVLN